MRRYKAPILLIFLSLCILLLTSCRCEPSTVEWHLLEVTEDVTFANGVTVEMTFGGCYGLTPYLTVETEFGELTVYDAYHFWYKGQSYVCVGETDFDFLFE